MAPWDWISSSTCSSSPGIAECSRKGRFEGNRRISSDARVRGEFINDDRTVRERAVFREQFDVYDGVRVGEEERKREHVLSRVVFVHGAVFAVGVVGV